MCPQATQFPLPKDNFCVYVCARMCVYPSQGISHIYMDISK